MSLISGYSFVEPLLRSLVTSKVREKMIKAEPKIIAGMTTKKMFPPLKTPAECSRDAIFRFWRTVLPGDLADAVRDHTSDSVVPAVLAELGDSPTLAEIVTTTCETILSRTLHA